MKAVLTTLGKFHSFDLARQLHARGALQVIYSGYPRFKLRAEQLPARMVRTYPYLHAPYMASGWRDRLGLRLKRQWEYWDRTSLDHHVARSLPDADLFIGLSSCGLATGREARRRGMKYVCDRGSTHIRHQNAVLHREHARWNMSFVGVDPRIIEREEEEYETADLITVPSHFVRDSFIAHGVSAKKVQVLSYGVDLERFTPVSEPKAGEFSLLFVGGLSLRKGVPQLLQAFHALAHPDKSLTIAGIADRDVLSCLHSHGLLRGRIQLLGHVPQPQLKGLMSRSHALVLPSVEEGLAMVMAQALACGCPVVATRNTGAQDLFSDGVEGYIVDAESPDVLTQRLQALADQPDLQQRMGQAALRRVRDIGGWTTYGDRAIELYQRLLATDAGAVP